MASSGIPYYVDLPSVVIKRLFANHEIANKIARFPVLPTNYIRLVSYVYIIQSKVHTC